jgi:integrase
MGIDPIAERKAREAEAEAARKAAVLTTLRDVLADYIDVYTHEAYDRLSADTADQYRRVLDNHCSDWLDRDVHLITEEEIERKHRAMRETKHVANQLVRVLRSLLRHAKIPVPPKFPWYPQGERKMDIVDLPLFREQVLSIEHPARRAIWLLAAYTGIRRQNLLELEWSNVDLRAKTLYLSKMKNGLDRTMPLSTQSVNVLRSMEGLDERWVFPGHGAGKHFVEVRDEKVPYIFHNTRRVFTQACASCLLPRYAINYLRGDKGQTIEEHYISELDLADVIKRVGNYLEQKMMPKQQPLEAVG